MLEQVNANYLSTLRRIKGWKMEHTKHFHRLMMMHLVPFFGSAITFTIDLSTHSMSSLRADASQLPRHWGIRLEQWCEVLMTEHARRTIDGWTIVLVSRSFLQLFIVLIRSRCEKTGKLGKEEVLTREAAVNIVAETVCPIPMDLFLSLSRNNNAFEKKCIGWVIAWHAGSSTSVIIVSLSLAAS